MQVETYIAAIYDGSKVVLIPTPSESIPVTTKRTKSYRVSSGYSNPAHITKDLAKLMLNQDRQAEFMDAY